MAIAAAVALSGLGKLSVDITLAERLLAKAVKHNLVPAMHLYYQLQHANDLRSDGGGSSRSGF